VVQAEDLHIPTVAYFRRIFSIGRPLANSSTSLSM
jgi:hypothetical protein